MVIRTRSPLAVVAIAVVGLGLLALAFSTLDDKANRVKRIGNKAERIRVDETPLLAGQLGYVNAELRRDQGRFAPREAVLATAYAGRLGERHRENLEREADRHRIEYRASPDRFDLRVYTGRDDHAWLGIRVNATVGRVLFRCQDAPGCAGGRWDSAAEAGLEPGLFLRPLPR